MPSSDWIRSILAEWPLTLGVIRLVSVVGMASLPDASLIIHGQSWKHVVACSRPTAVNLQDAASKLTAITRQAAQAPNATSSSVVSAYVHAAEEMVKADIAANKVHALGKPAHKSVTCQSSLAIL